MDHLEEFEAVRLFSTRSRAAHTAFALTLENAADVAEICRRLDGLPLAIELAAVRTRHLTPGQILARLTDRFSLLVLPGMPARHRSMRAAIDWSYTLLAPAEQTLFCRLSVFAGSFSVEAVEAICSGGDVAAQEVLDVLAGLIDKTLVEVEETQVGAVRYRLLETMREYGAERLAAAGEWQRLRERHRDFFLHLAEEWEAHSQAPDLGEWLRRLEDDHSNLRAALTWSLETSQEAEGGMRLAAALRRFWQLRGHMTEARGWYEKALARDQGAPSIWRARLLNALAGTLGDLGERGRVESFYEESLRLFRELGDRSGVIRVMTNLGSLAMVAKDQAKATRLFEESLELCRETGDRHGVAFLLVKLGNVARELGDFERALQFYEEGVKLYRELGDRWGTAWALNLMGLSLRIQGDFARARECHDQSLAIYDEFDERYDRPMVYLNLGYEAQHEQDFDAATQHFATALDGCREMGDRLGVATATAALGGIAALKGESGQAVKLFAAAENLRLRVGSELIGPRVDREDNARNLATARAALGEERFARLWEDGLRMTVEEAVAQVVSSLPPRSQSGAGHH